MSDSHAIPKGQIIEMTGPHGGQRYWAFYPTDNTDVYGRPVFTSWNKQSVIDWVERFFMGKKGKTNG